MNRNTDQFATSTSLRVPGGAAGHPASAPRSYPAAGAEPALFRVDLLRSLQMHRRLALALVLCGLILAAGYLACYWRMYTAQALVYIQPTPSVVLEGPAPMHWPYNYDPATYDSYVAQQMLSMKHPGVLIGALHKMDPGTFQQSGESDERAADRLSGAVEVKRVETSYQVAVTAHASHPDTAAAIANAVAASYIEDTKHQQSAGDAERLAMLKDERDRVKKELDDDRAEQAALNAQLGVAAIGPAAPEHYDSDIAAIHDELVKARADHDEAAARLTSVSAGSGVSSAAMNAEADQLIASDPGLASLKSALLQRRAALVSQMANLTPNHPQYKQDEAELQKIDASLDSSTQDLRAKAAARIEEQLRTDLDRTSGLEVRLNGQLAEMTRAAASATPKLQRSSDLASDIERLQNRFNTVDEQLQNQTLEDNAPGTALLAETAVAPLHPSDTGVIRNALALFLFFTMLGLAAAVTAHKMDPRVYVASDVEHLLGFAPMAQLPDFDEVPDEVADEHLLRLAAGIEYACKDGGIRTCVFTGTGPGAGATTLATRVRDTLGMLGRNAVLSESAPRAEGNEQHVARSTALTPPGSEAAVSKSGMAPESAATESLVLTDAAPLTVSAESEYMARCADCTFLVIESGVTTRQQLRAAAGVLQRLNPAAVGLVLNRVGLAKADPAFRRSVNDVAAHLRSQNRASARPTVRNLHVAAESPKAIAEPKSAPKIEPKIAPQIAPMIAPMIAPKIAAPQETAAGQFAFAVAPPVFERPAAAERAPVVPAERVPAAPVPRPQPAAVAPSMWQEDQPIQRPSAGKQAAGSAPERASLLQQAAIVPELPREVEPISKLFTGYVPEPTPLAQPAPLAPAVVKENQRAENQRAENQPAPKSPSKPAANPTPEAVARPAQQPVLPPDPQPVEEVPWWLTEAPVRSDWALAKPRATRVGNWFSDSKGSVGHEPVVDEAPRRLGGLRGILFSLGIKEMGPAKDSAANAKAGPARSGVPVEPAHVEPAPVEPAHEEPVPVGKFAPPPEPVHAAAADPATRSFVPRWVTAEPEFLPPKMETAGNGKESRRSSSARQERGDTFDEVDILPSQRGQYRRGR